MARQILLRKANTKGPGLEAVSAVSIPADLLSLFPKGKRPKIQKMLNYLHNDTAFHIHPQSLEITPAPGAPYYFSIDTYARPSQLAFLFTIGETKFKTTTRNRGSSLNDVKASIKNDIER